MSQLLSLLNDAEEWLPPRQYSHQYITICCLLTSPRLGQSWLFQLYPAQLIQPTWRLSRRCIVQYGLAVHCSATTGFFKDH